MTPRCRRTRRAALQRWFCALPLLLGLALASCQETRPQVVFFTQGGGEIPVLVEIADTPESRNHGLMYRTELAENHGVLFLFEDEAKRSFWMKNTPIALDMVFLSPDGHVVGIVENAEPFSLKTVGVAAPSKAVVEVNGGFSSRHHLAIGDRAEFRNVR
jgi:uncharacterized membrane protein (UPF0127 family)